MNLYEHLNPGKLADQIANGMVKRQEHPTLPLSILNYTQKAQFTPELWNEVTDKCRGLIFHRETGDIVSRPFVKFWNLSDPRHPETLFENLPPTPPTITAKMDGSLGIYYQCKGEVGIATRGSFTSEQAVWATRWLRGHAFVWPEGYTPLFEIIYPENQIVVRYDFSGLVLLALVNIETGEELPYYLLQQAAEVNGLRVVEQFDKPLSVCVTEDADNEEGYVATWHRPGTWPLRVKIKMETYCRMHRLLTQTNPVTVWEMLKDGLDLTTLTSNVPADFVSWIHTVEAQLRSSYETIEQAALSAMLEYDGEKVITTPEERKRFALYAVSKQPVTPILFAMLDGKDYAPIIWKMIRPKVTDTFKVDVDG